MNGGLVRDDHHCQPCSFVSLSLQQTSLVQQLNQRALLIDLHWGLEWRKLCSQSFGAFVGCSNNHVDESLHDKLDFSR